MFSCETKMTKDVATELMHPVKVWAIVLTSVGGAGVFIWLASAIAFKYELNLYFGLVFWLALVIGIIYFVLIGATKRNNEKTVNSVNEYEFYDQFFIIKSTQNGEVLANIKSYYNTMLKVRETKNYIFIYPNKALAYPVAKSALSEENMTSLRKIFKLEPPKGQDK